MKSLVGYAPLLAPLAPVLLLAGALWGGSRSPSAAELLVLEPRFTTTDASEIFFRNIRSIHYEKRPGPAEGFDLYYLRGLGDAPISPFIAHHWLADRAYVMYEPSSDPLRIGGHTTSLETELPDDAFRTTMQLCAAFERNEEVWVGGRSLSNNRRHVKLLQRLCRDYLELVELF